MFCTKKGTKGALKARAAKPLWPSSSFYRRPYYRLTIAPFKSTFYWEKSEKKEESIVIQKNGMTCIVINTNVQKNVIDFCLPFFYARGNMSQVSHISFISNPEHLEAGGKNPKKFHYAFVLLLLQCCKENR